MPPTNLLDKLITATGLLSLTTVAATDDANLGYLHMPFKRFYAESREDFSRKFLSKSSALQEKVTFDGTIALQKEETFYAAEVEIGTPSQKVVVLMDTGSSDLWVVGADTISCPIVGGSLSCVEDGTFSIKNSSTFHSNDTLFYIEYADTDFAAGTWGRDVVSVGNLVASGLSFGVANTTNSTVGIFGIGLEGLENSNSPIDDYHEYMNFPEFLKSEGAIKHVGYSLFLNESISSSGSILFGAVDHSKYSGPLYKLPLINTLADEGFKKPIEFDITLQGLSLNSGNKKTNLTTTQIPALLDSGTTDFVVPPELFAVILDELGGLYMDETDISIVSCPTENSKMDLVFDFGGFELSLDLNNFIFYDQEQNVCVLSISDSDSENIILGDAFLTGVYVVYDLENLGVALANADYSSKPPQIEIMKGSIPNATMATGYSNTWSQYAITATESAGLPWESSDMDSTTTEKSKENSKNAGTVQVVHSSWSVAFFSFLSFLLF